jgi:colanic acid/amylovoran biosynthesis glycosyltransferase
MKTVIHYIAGPYLSITETWIYGQIKNLKKYQPIVYTLKTENLDIYPTEKIRSLELKNGLRNVTTFLNKGWNKLFGFYPPFALYLAKDRPNLVHAHFGPSGYNFLDLKRIFKIPLVTTFYGFDLSMLPNQHPVWQKRYRELFRQGDRFLVEGSHMEKCLMDLGCPENKITVQHLGVDLNQIKFVQRKPEKSGKICVLIAGSYREKKGIPYAIEAFGRVRQAYPQLKLELTIIGDSTGASREEKEKRKILVMVKKYGLDGCIRMMGYQPYPVFLKEIEKHHIFLSPSIHASNGDTEGGVPVSIIEASASGMPVLSTTHCDIPEVIIDRGNGYLVPERDTDALVEKLGLLISNPDIREQMGRKGREHVEKNYNITTQVQKLEEIYDMVARRRE